MHFTISIWSGEYQLWIVHKVPTWNPAELHEIIFQVDLRAMKIWNRFNIEYAWPKPKASKILQGVKKKIHVWVEESLSNRGKQ